MMVEIQIKEDNNLKQEEGGRVAEEQESKGSGQIDEDRQEGAVN